MPLHPASRPHTPPPSHAAPRSGVVLYAGAVLVLAMGGWAAMACAQGPGAAATASSPTATKAPSKPLWRDLGAKQQQALLPLAAHWDSLNEAHKRKWLAFSRNFAQLSPADKTTLHSRMTEWASLSPQQRAQARFNFAEVKQVPADERKAKWEAYQALTPEARRQLAERAAPRPPGAAATIRPVPAQKLAPVLSGGTKGQHTARIELTPPPPPAPPMIAAPSVAVETPVSAPAPVLAPAPAPAPVPPARMTEQPSSAP